MILGDGQDRLVVVDWGDVLDWRRYALGDYCFVDCAPGNAVLDLGCGEGRELQELDRKGCIAFGIEPDWESLQSCRRRGLKVLQARGEHLPVRNSSLDGLICKVVIPYTEERRALNEIGRVLKVGAVARLCYHGAGYYLRYLLVGPSWRFRFYGLRTLVNTWLYAHTGRCLPGYLGDTLYQSQRRLTRYYRENGLHPLRESPSRRFLRLPVFIFHAIQKVGDHSRFSEGPAREMPATKGP